MSIFNHQLISKFEKIFLLLSKVYEYLFSKNSLRVIVYHNIEKKNFNILSNQLSRLKEKYNFITPKEFEEHILKKKKLLGKNLLLTFDDGFESNYYVEKKILKRLNIKAVFFIPSDFIKLKLKEKSILFIKNNILNLKNFQSIQNFNNVSIQNLKYLIKNGHEIGCHTKTHANLGSIKNKKILNSEIRGSKIELQKILNFKIKHFAYTYGNFKSINNESLQLSYSNYQFVYSCLRGNNFRNKKNSLIKRDPIYLNQNFNLIKIFLSGLIDLRYFIFIIYFKLKNSKF